MSNRIQTALIAAILMAAAVLTNSAPTDTASADAAALDPEEQLLVTLINQYRQQNGLSALAINPELVTATEWMSPDMGANDYFSHCDLHGQGPGPYPCSDPCTSPCRDPFQRMRDFGYNYNTWLGENLAAGTSSAQTAFDMWKTSPGHNANMLSSNYKVMGIARAYTAASSFGWYWTNDFGGYTPDPASDPSLDSDGDGFTNGVETSIGTDWSDPCGNDGWPGDLFADNILNISDFNSFIFPMRPDGSFSKLGHSLPDPLDPQLLRWDLDANSIINIGDLNSLNPGTLAATARPPMFGGQPAFFTNDGQCPFPP